MNEYKKFYDYAFSYYKHYFEDNCSKNQTSSGTFYKNKRTALK
jgi:hypothetical protein